MTAATITAGAHLHPLKRIPTPEGKRDTWGACAVCGQPLPLIWWEETRGSGRVLVYPTLDDSKLGLLRGRNAHRACLSKEPLVQHTHYCAKCDAPIYDNDDGSFENGRCACGETKVRLLPKRRKRTKGGAK